MSHLETSDRDTDADNCSDSDVRVDECDEDEESPPIECAFFSKNIYNVLDVQTTPPPAVASADDADSANDADSADANETDTTTTTAPSVCTTTTVPRCTHGIPTTSQCHFCMIDSGNYTVINS